MLLLVTENNPLLKIIILASVVWFYLVFRVSVSFFANSLTCPHKYWFLQDSVLGHLFMHLLSFSPVLPECMSISKSVRPTHVLLLTSWLALSWASIPHCSTELACVRNRTHHLFLAWLLLWFPSVSLTVICPLRNLGIMFRPSLSVILLSIFPSSQKHVFWSSDTFIHLLGIGALPVQAPSSLCFHS